MSYNRDPRSKGLTKGKIIAMVLAITAVLGFFTTWALFMHTAVVNPGHQLVVNDKPYFFGRDGVRPEPITEGRVLLFNTSSAEVVRMTPQSTPIVIDDFSSKNNILLDFGTTIQWRVEDSVALVKNFGVEDWFKNNLHNQYLAIVRDAVKRRTMEEMMSDPNAATEVDNEITAGVRKLVADEKLPIVVLNVSLGRAKPNPNVLEQMNQTAQQEQRKKSLFAATDAEKQREQEQIAKARADNAYRNAMSLSPEQFIQLEAIKRFSEACEKSTCVIGQPGVGLNLGSHK